MFESAGRVCLRMAIREVKMETETEAQHGASVLLSALKVYFCIQKDPIPATSTGSFSWENNLKSKLL